MTGRDDTPQRAPQRNEEPYPPLSARDKAVLVGVFLVSFGALAAIIAWWDRLPFVGRPG